VAHFADQGEWFDPAGLLMAVEVTSYDREHDRRVREEKPEAYAAAGIPVHLLVDREAGLLLVHRNPDLAVRGYRDIHRARIGERVTLPAPVGIELDTTALIEYSR
jgi:hypothetical protein